MVSTFILHSIYLQYNSIIFLQMQHVFFDLPPRLRGSILHQHTAKRNKHFLHIQIILKQYIDILINWTFSLSFPMSLP